MIWLHPGWKPSTVSGLLRFICGQRSHPRVVVTIQDTLEGVDMVKERYVVYLLSLDRQLASKTSCIQMQSILLIVLGRELLSRRV
jgi:hypothetical protein